uniref:Uncharacterized protein n=1 Tax=Populus davidiana TaxID=266767 RepID=A0A6M2EK97_9ROSI
MTTNVAGSWTAGDPCLLLFLLFGCIDTFLLLFVFLRCLPSPLAYVILMLLGSVVYSSLLLSLVQLVVLKLDVDCCFVAGVVIPPVWFSLFPCFFLLVNFDMVTG